MIPAVAAIIPYVAKSAYNIIDQYVTDKDERARAKEALDSKEMENQISIQLAQLAINKQEAAHKSLFVAGWRPALGWVFAVGFLFNFIIIPLMNYSFNVASIWFIEARSIPPIPFLDFGEMLPILAGMLGLSGMRSWEKYKMVARDE